MKGIGCEGYGAIASVYDRLNRGIDYSAWADFVVACFGKFLPAPPELVLDLACGTGSMTIELAKRGFDMIGVDGSAEMLSRAYSRSLEHPGILYLQQDMRSFELYGTVGAVTCCLDSVNYLLTQKDLDACFACVHNYLDPDGLFLFDVNSPYKFRHVYGDNAYVLEDEIDRDDGEAPQAVYCGWQNAFSEDTNLCDFDLSLFSENEDGSYRREDEHQTERCYTAEEIKDSLACAGFEFLGVWSDWSFSPPNDTTERYYFAARAKKPLFDLRIEK